MANASLALAERPEPVDGHRHVAGGVGGIRGAAARDRGQRAAEVGRAALEQRDGGGARVHRREPHAQAGLDAHAVDVARHAVAHPLERVVVERAHVAGERAAVGHAVHRLAAREDRRDNVEAALGLRVAREPAGEPGDREQRRSPALGGGAGVRGTPARRDLEQRRAASADHDRLTLGPALAALEAQARVLVEDVGAVAQRAPAPLLVGDAQQVDPVEGLRAGGERTRDAGGEHEPALHVVRAGALQQRAVLLERPVALRPDDRVDVAEQQQPAPARVLDARRQLLDVRRDRRVAAVAFAGPRRDVDERAEIVRGPVGDPLGMVGDEGVHGSDIQPVTSPDRSFPGARTGAEGSDHEPRSCHRSRW